MFFKMYIILKLNTTLFFNIFYLYLLIAIKNIITKYLNKISEKLFQNKEQIKNIDFNIN